MRYITRNDVKLVARDLGVLMIGIGVMCLIPLVINPIFLEANIVGFVVPGLISIGLGFFLLNYYEKYDKRIRMKHGMMISSLGWIWAGLIGGLVFSITTNIPFIDGMFESVSALTGTGMTIYGNLEILPYSIIFFRAFQQWIGGLGVIVMVLVFVARPGSLTSKLYQSEARDDRIRPSIRSTIKEILKIYSIFTVAGIILLALAGMPVFDSICNTFCLISTGGMCVKNANIGYYHSDLIYLISMIIMIMGATSFLVHYNIKKTRGKSLLEDLQFKVILSIIAFVSMALYFVSSIVPMDLLFTVVSTITTTGATVASPEATAAWPSVVLVTLMCLMIVGGSSGSTSGAVKLVRVITFIKGIRRNIREIISPEGRVIPIKLNGNKIPEKAIGQAGTFIALYMICIVIVWLLFCLFGYDPFKGLFTAISLQGNNGLELGVIKNTMHPILKLAGIIDMWIGRLEIYPLLLLLRTGLEVFRR